MNLELKEQIDRRERVFTQVVELLIDALRLEQKPSEIDPDTPFFGSGLGLDSVDAVEIVVSMESEFGIAMEEEESMIALRTVNSLVDVVINRMEE